MGIIGYNWKGVGSMAVASGFEGWKRRRQKTMGEGGSRRNRGCEDKKVRGYGTKGLASGVKLYLIFCFLILIALLVCSKEKDSDGFMKPIISSGEHEPAFSPDGKFIAYMREPDDEIPNYQIWLFEMATEESEYLADGFSPDWSPDGKWIAYVYNRNIYKINVETKEIKQLTTWGSCFFPDWHPEGFKFAYRDSDGVRITDSNFTSTKFIARGDEPDWSPNGDKIVYIGSATVTFPEIFLIDTLGNDPVRLTVNGYEDRSPVFSPDGSKIAYVSNYNIWVMDTNGGNKTQLTFEPQGENWSAAYDPAWSPNGNQIVYTLTKKIEKKDVIEYHYHLWLMDAGGENKRQLTGKVTRTFGCK